MGITERALLVGLLVSVAGVIAAPIVALALHDWAGLLLALPFWPIRHYLAQADHAARLHWEGR